MLRAVSPGVATLEADPGTVAVIPVAKPRRHRLRQLLPILIGLAALSAGLRLVDLDRNPPALFEDELSGAVSAWSIATTGHDVERTVLPFLVTRLELKQPVYFFATVPFQAVLGHGAVAVRLPAVVFGVVSTMLMVWLLVVLRAGTTVALMGGALFAISPWAIHYARAGWEPAAFLPFAMAGVGLLWVGLRDHRRRWTVAAAVVLAFGAYTYHPALLMDVVLPTTVVLIRRRTVGRPDLVNLAIGAGVAIVILTPYGLALTDPVFLARTRSLSVFRDGVTGDALALAWSNYWAQWSPEYLLGGAAPNPRINPGILVYAWTVPFFVAGLDRLIHRRRPEDILVLAWLVLGALPAAITDDRTTPHAARGLLVLPALTAITAIGLGRGLVFLRSRPGLQRIEPLGIVLVGVLAAVATVSFLGYYLGPYVAKSANWWGYGSAIALERAGEVVPAGSVLCIATNDISGFTFAHQMVDYLPDPGFRIVRGVSDPVCRQVGTYLLALVSRDLKLGVRDVATTPDYAGAPLYRVVQVTSSS
jgi:4-amino-4-deoxy-L-arabinose transferase-like glycosyltransferase